jgi:4-hydroxy-tetrahydrodipicolinate synthase
MSNTELRGVIVPAITPIDEREDIDEAAFRKIIRRLIRAGVHSVFVGGSAGEGPLLVDSQWRRMVEIAFDEVRGELPLLAGVMDTSSRKVCEKIKLLRDIGYRYFVLTPTFYLTVKTPESHLRLFGQAKEAAGDMEMIAYNIPQCTGSTLAVETACEMARRGWIRYCKESSGDWPYLRELIQRGKEVGMGVLVGDELVGGEALLAGAKGVVFVCANYDPLIALNLYNAGTRGDRDEVARLMARLLLVREHLVVSGPCWLSGIKYALAALGIGSGQPLSPLEPVGAQRKAKIDERVQSDRGTVPC